MDKQAISFIAIAVFNVATVLLVRHALKDVDLRQAVLEKDPSPAPAAQSAATAGAVAAAPPPAQPMTSYSRVAGLVGALVLATFFWGIGNAVIYGAINDPNNVATMLNGVSSFIIGGASLFLPYAANQVREAFTPRNQNPQKPTGTI